MTQSRVQQLLNFHRQFADEISPDDFTKQVQSCVVVCYNKEVAWKDKEKRRERLRNN